jgi:hypothetical protein
VRVTIDIHYVSSNDNRTLQSGSFPLRGRSPVRVAYEFWKYIQKEHSYELRLETVIADGNNDITEQVKELEQRELARIMNDDIPF